MSQDPWDSLRGSSRLWEYRNYILLRPTKDHRVVADVEVAALKIRAHVSDYESLVFSCLCLQRLRKARKFDSVNGLVIAVAAPF